MIVFIGDGDEQLEPLNELKSFSCHVEVVDPHADSTELQEEYGFNLVEQLTGLYQAVVVAVNHEEYVHMGESDFKMILSDNGLLVDIKGIFRNKIQELDYWTL